MLALLLFSFTNTFSQRMDPYSSLFQMPDSSYVRINYDNDVFMQRDYYYTQGFSLDIFNPAFKRNPINKILMADPAGNINQYGIRLTSGVYTPTSISSDTIIRGDRPFAAVASVSFVRMSLNSKENRKVSAAIDLGVIGPAALGEEIQSGIHQATGNKDPQGWQHQVGNSPLVNYTLQIEQQVLEKASFFSAGTVAGFQVGTYRIAASLGIELSVGKKNNYFTGTQNKFQYYFYSQSYMRAVGYDASLMGGMFNSNDPYNLKFKEMEPLVAEQHIGLAFIFPHVYTAFDLGFITQEIVGGRLHQWAGIRLGFY